MAGLTVEVYDGRPSVIYEGPPATGSRHREAIMFVTCTGTSSPALTTLWGASNVWRERAQVPTHVRSLGGDFPSIACFPDVQNGVSPRDELQSERG